jgi:acyl transferase domain-containing protein
MLCEPIAIIGTACRVPGADSLCALWKVLGNGIDPIRETPESRWKIDDYYDPVPGTPGKMYVRRFGFIDAIDQFDSHLFGISPRDTASMDPQHRLMLELSWEALEHAGIAPNALAGTSTGVFTGISGSEFSYRLAASESSSGLMDKRSGIGNSRSLAANRLSHALDLRGPSMVIDTACSSALVAIHLACQSLRAGECEIAVAGAVNVLLSPLAAITFCQSRMLSPDGRSKVFDAAADGYVRSEGCGAIVLKRLNDAIAGRDRIWGVIRGSAVNHNGRTSGIVAPSPRAQAAVIRDAIKNAGAHPSDIGYIEAHGSGTTIGDLLEMRALAAVMPPPTGPRDRCWVGSAKASIGHLEAASGIAGILKVLLCFEHGRIPPQANLSSISPQISSLDSRARVVADEVRWPRRRSAPRLAGVSAFGFGGSNAHIVLEEPPATTSSRRAVGPATGHLLKLSAKGPASMRRLAEQWVEFLGTSNPSDLPDICYTANTGRTDFAYRMAITAGSLLELRTKLSNTADAPDRFTRIPAKPPLVGFLFGPIDDLGKARLQLSRRSTVFRQALDEFHQSSSGGCLAFHQAIAEMWRALGFAMDAVSGIGCGQRSAAAITEDKAVSPQALSESVDVVVTIGSVPLPQTTRDVWLRSVVPGCDAWRSFLESVAELYMRGCNVRWSNIDSRPERQKLPVPTYAFARERHPFPF